MSYRYDRFFGTTMTAQTLAAVGRCLASIVIAIFNPLIGIGFFMASVNPQVAVTFWIRVAADVVRNFSVERFPCRAR